MTVRHWIDNAVNTLSLAGVESPRVDAEWLLTWVVGIPRMELALAPDRLLTSGELQLLASHLERRARRVPLQHLLGTADFCGFELEVTPDVLIPRPETEQLAELAWTFLRSCPGGWDADTVGALDYGTGTGCLAISLAAMVPGLVVEAVDTSVKALAVADRNLRRHRLEGRVRLTRAERPGMLADRLASALWLVISNPPYIPTGVIAGLEPEVRDHDPRLALDGGVDGLDFYRLLAVEAGGLLRVGGKLMVELGDEVAPQVPALFLRENWVVESVLPDYNRRPRILVASKAA